MTNPIEHWGGGVVKVELTDRQRASLSQVIRANAPQIIAIAEHEDPTLHGFLTQRHTTVLASPRSRLPLWEVLARARTTTVRFYRRSALAWAKLVLQEAEGLAPGQRRAQQLACIACTLLIAATARPGKRPRVPDALVVRVVTDMRARGQRRAVAAAAELLGMDEQQIRRALQRAAQNPAGLIEAAVTRLS